MVWVLGSVSDVLSNVAPAAWEGVRDDHRGPEVCYVTVAGIYGSNNECVGRMELLMKVWVKWNY